MTVSPEQNPDPFEQRLAEAIDAGELIPAGASVLVGVSGGADSIALLHGLKRLAGQPARAYRLVVGHLDHTLRADSAGDADFVAAQADALGLECVRRQCDVAALAQQQGQGVEQAARMARYRFFREEALACRAQIVAVAHQADDNVETILFRLFRGTALRGLAGMADKRPLPESEIMLVRPMLGLWREDVLAYCRRRGLTWREDHTNAETAYRRNFIRHELLPRVRRDLNDKADQAVLRLGELARQAEDYIARQAEALLDRSVVFEETGRILIDLTMFASDPPDPVERAVRTTACRLALERLGMPQRDLSAEHLAAVDALLVGSGRTVNLPEGFVARRRGKQLILAASERNSHATD